MNIHLGSLALPALLLAGLALLPAASAHARQPDAWITTKVKTKLADNRYDAVVIAHTTDGVRSVRDDLRLVAKES